MRLRFGHLGVADIPGGFSLHKRAGIGLVAEPHIPVDAE